ncbi:biotin/lipoyl-binding protein [bacterium]|nr:biotin/lipoyl-binding protein [bacterium]
MRLVATVGKTEEELSVTSAAGKINVNFSGSEDTFELLHSEGNELFFLFNNKVCKMNLVPSDGKYLVFINHRWHSVNLEDEKIQHLKKFIKFTGSEVAEGQIVSKMPGLVVSVKCKVGDEVQQGDTLLVIESMKMENEISAPISGKITKLEVEKGQTVEKGVKMILVS